MSPTYPQIIPRPDNWEMGSPAPWASLGEISRRSIDLRRVLTSLEASGLLGPPPYPPRRSDVDPIVHDGASSIIEFRHSAVLVALFEEEGEARVVLTRRATHLRTHKGEVSFPGGRIDEGEDSVQAALREAAEEVALDPTSVAVVGHLQPIITLVSGALIQPVIAVLDSRPTLKAAPAEVERVFDVALADLLGDDVFHEERWRRPDLLALDPTSDSFPLWFFEISGEMVWGATGRLLVDLLMTILG